MRYFIEIAYNGKNYHGWQIQPNAITVQEVLEKSLSTLLRKSIKITGAGRTDAGVHAKQLVAHFDSQKMDALPLLVHRLNSFLPGDISIKRIVPVKPDAHARFDAVSREYQYVISAEKNPFLQDFAYLLYQKPDIKRMNEVCETLLDFSNFQCFSRAHSDVKTYVCNITQAIWEEKENKTLVFTIKADRFLRNMVRAIVGTLLEVGYAKISKEDFVAIINSKDRSKAGASAPAHGLYLTSVSYPKNIYK